jgi:hypothetical protein
MLLKHSAHNFPEGKKMKTPRTAKIIFVLFTFFFLFSWAPEICRFLPGPEEAQAAAPESSWWNLNYGARKKITITAGSAQVPTGYSVSTTLDHAGLVTAKQSLSSGNDVRVAYYNGSTWTELHRLLDTTSSWNNASTMIWFKTQAVINSSSSDDNYYLYYSYPSATNPPVTPSNVFLFYDGFESGDFNAWDGYWNGEGDSITIVSSSFTAPDTGSGGDGSVTISGASNINTNVLGSGRSTYADGISTTVTANPTGTSITVTSTTGFAANDEIILINLQGASGDTDNVGNYEFLEIDSVPNSTTLNLKASIQKSYDGNSFSNQKVIVQRVPQWTSVTINNGGSLTANDWSGSSGGVLVFRATGTVTVNSGGNINVNARGYRKGNGVTGNRVYGWQAESYAGTGSQDITNNGGGGGGGDCTVNGSDYCGEGGGGGGYGTAGTHGSYGASCGGSRPQANAGSTYGIADLTKICLGSGGGGGYNDEDAYLGTSGTGGDGGGIIMIFANTITVSGAIEAKGDDGGTYTTDCSDNGSGGGGAGGSIYLWANTATLGTNLVKATGGAGGSSSCGDGPWHGAGGDGGKGRIRVDASSLSGSADPSPYTTGSDPVRSGTYSSKCVTDTVAGDGARATSFKDFSDQPTIYVRTYVYLSSSTFPPAADVVLVESVDPDPTWQNILSVTLRSDMTLMVWNSVAGEGYTPGSPTTLSTNTWYRIDAKFAVSATAGEAKVWINGNLEIDATSKNTGTRSITRVHYGNFWQGDDTDANTFYFDDNFIRIGVTPEPTTSLASTEGRYEYRKKLTIQSSQVGGSCSSNLSNFPVLVSLSAKDWLKTKANDPTNGRIYNSNGYDICFRGADPETVLNYEIEKYDGSAGTLVAWVKIPILSYNQNTDFYIYYGNPAVTSAPAASVAQGVWSNNYAAVYHLNGNANDSTGNYNGSIGGATSTSDGRIAGAYEFNGSNQYIDANFAPNWGSGGFTIEVWWNADSLSGERMIVGVDEGVTGESDTTHAFCRIEIENTNHTHHNFIHTEGTGGGNREDNYRLLSTLSTGTWYHTVLRRPTGCIQGFLNGSDMEGYGCETLLGETNFSADFNIGRLGGLESNYFDGKIDEVRFSNVARDSCWIETSFSSMNSPSSFISEGTEQRPIPTAVTLRTFKALQHGDGVLLRWKTSHEVNNLGFNVHRESNGELVRLTPELITGSALLAGSGTPLTAGHHYLWWDNSTVSAQPSAVSGQRSSLRYWLEDVDLTGQRTFHGPVEVQLSASSFELSAPDLRRAELLSEFGARLQEKYADFWKIQDFREKLKEKNDRGASRLRRDSRSGLSGLEDRPSALRQKNFGLLTSSEALLKRSAPRGNLVPDPRANAVQRSLAGRPAMKLLVREEGWYRVSQPELAAAGMNTHFNPKHLHLYAEGQELPIRVIAEKEGRLGPKDAIEFYGIGLDTPSTDARVYWLVVSSKPGKRINSHISSPQFRNPQSEIRNAFESSQFRDPQSAIRNSFESSQFRNPHSAIRNSFESFPYTAESKERSFYFPALLNGEESNFFGPIIYTYRVDQLLYVWDADPTSREDALLEVALQGATAGPHRVKVFFNDAEVGEVSFSGQSQGRFQTEIPVSVLQEGENLVSFIAHGGEMDVSLLDSIQLTYWRAYRAHENGLKLTAQGGRQVSVGGFSHAQVQVVDITDPLSVMEVEGKVTKTQGSGYAITFRAPGSGPRTLLAIGVEKAKSPAQVVLNQPSNWNQRGNGYDLVIISHKDFLESMKPLKTLREAQGLSVALVDVEDVYDEFSFGSKTPQAIKDFLQRAKSSWKKAPRFVLLVGDASYDPRNFLGYGDLDFVPTKLVDTAYLETASDDWFVDFDGNGLPKMALGRLPVQTPAEASTVVAKIIAYEKSAGTNEALLVADRTEETDNFDFVEAAQKVGALFPSSVGLRKVFRGEFGSDAQAKEALLHYLGQGPLMVNYLGHGGMMEWRGNLFNAEDAEALPSAGRLPFYISMTCLNGFFQAPYGDTLAESLLKAEQGGAVAVWTSSGMTEPGGQLKMNQELVRQLFNGEDLTIGEAIMKAKRTTSDKDIRRTWILFGDPTTRLK